MSNPLSPLREQILRMFKAALGEPEVSHVTSGDLFRWTLRRQSDINMYVSMDSPEHTDLAHILVSDSTEYQTAPVVSTVLYSLHETEALLKRVLEQWKHPQRNPEARRNPEPEDIGGSGHGGRPPPQWTRGPSDRESRTE